jgi:type III secretion protein L
MRSSMSATVTRIDRTSSGQELPRSPTSAVVRREDVEAWKSGFAFMKAAEARARMIEEAARDAFQAARERGHAEGYRAGVSEAQKAMAEQLAKTSIEVSKYLNAIDGQIVGTVMAAIRSVLGGVPDADLVIKAAAQVMCRQAMERLHGAATLVAKVHPDMVNEVDAALQALVARSGGSVRVEADPGLPSRTSLVLQTPFAVVNAGIEEQLSAIEQAMRASPRSAPGQPMLRKPPEVPA